MGRKTETQYDNSNQMRSRGVEGNGNGAIWRGILCDISYWDHFDMPIWLPKETQEEDIIAKAHVMLHDLASRIADQTAGWKINRQSESDTYSTNTGGEH